NSRWIVSALDTFVDHGEPAERANAMMIVTFANVLKLADTEYVLCDEPAYDAERLGGNVKNYPCLWDGGKVLHLPDAVTFANMVNRMRKTLLPTPLFRLMFESLLNRARSHETLLTRLGRHHKRSLW